MVSTCDEKAAVARRKQGRRGQRDTIENRTRRAEMLVQWVSTTGPRRCIPGSCDRGNSDKVDRRNEASIRPLEPLPRGVVDHAPVKPFDLDEKLFLRCLRSSRRGATAGPSRMTTEHLRPLLDEWSSVQVLFKAGEVFARAEIPDTVIQMVKMGG